MAPPLGPVRLAGATLAQAPADEIEEAVHTVAGALASQVARLRDDYQLVAAGRQDETAYLSELEGADAMLAISDVAQEFAAIGSSILEGALRRYVSETDYHTISLDIQGALRIGRDARAAAGSMPGRSASRAAAEAYFMSRVQDLRDLRDAAEQLVVIAENGEVPVREPGEEHAVEATATLVAVGALVLGGFVWWAVGG